MLASTLASYLVSTTTLCRLSACILGALMVVAMFFAFDPVVPHCAETARKHPVAAQLYPILWALGRSPWDAFR